MAERSNGFESDIFVDARERDAVTIVREASKKAWPKRFYRAATVEERDGAFAVLLDGRPVRTPKQAPLALPTHAAAELLAAEWAAQGDTIQPASMPATRLVNAALDGVATEMAAVAADVVKYAGSDLVCYRATEPPALVAAQNKAWDPVVAFAGSDLGARMIVTAGIVFAAQPPEALDAVRRAVDAVAESPHAHLRVAALHLTTTLTGSALIALAVARGALSPEEAWQAAHVDEDEQMRVWGLDAEALRRRASRFADFSAACALQRALDA